MRFIFNFFFFGILFYLIYLFFPDAFNTLVNWANQTYEYLRELFINLSNKIRGNQDQSSYRAFLSLIIIPYYFLRK